MDGLTIPSNGGRVGVITVMLILGAGSRIAGEPQGVDAGVGGSTGAVLDRSVRDLPGKGCVRSIDLPRLPRSLSLERTCQQARPGLS